MPQQPQIDPETGERIEIDPNTGERVKGQHLTAGQRYAAARDSGSLPKKQVTLGGELKEYATTPIGNYLPGYAKESEALRAGPRSVKEAEFANRHPMRYAVDRFSGGVEADVADMVTPLTLATLGLSSLGKLPGAVGTLARLGSRATTAGFGVKGAMDVVGAGTENTPEAWARRLSGLSQVVAAPAAFAGAPQNRGARLSSGAGLTQGEEALKPIIPELDETLHAQGKTEVKTIGEFQNLVRDTNGRLETEYQGALKPVAKTQLNTQSVADAITNEITPNMLNTQDGRLMAKELWRRAREFDQSKPWTVEELDLEREKLAKSYSDAKPSDVAADLKLKARQIADRAANKAVNDMLYSLADKTAGKAAGYFKALKQKQSVLFDMTDDAKAQKDAVTAGSAQGKGKLLRETISPRSAGYPKTGALRETAKVVANKLIDPLDTANAKIKKAFGPAPRRAGAATIGAAAESLKHDPRHPSDVYSDPSQLQQ